MIMKMTKHIWLPFHSHSSVQCCEECKQPWWASRLFQHACPGAAFAGIATWKLSWHWPTISELRCDSHWTALPECQKNKMYVLISMTLFSLFVFLFHLLAFFYSYHLQHGSTIYTCSDLYLLWLHIKSCKYWYSSTGSYRIWWDLQVANELKGGQEMDLKENGRVARPGD